MKHLHAAEDNLIAAPFGVRETRGLALMPTRPSYADAACRPAGHAGLPVTSIVLPAEGGFFGVPPQGAGHGHARGRRSPWAWRAEKVSLATTNHGDWFVAALLCEGNPYDGHTLKRTLKRVESNTATRLSDVYVDMGYRGHDYDGEAQVHRAGAGSKRATRATRKRRRRRSAIEPKIGHAKTENRMDRCYLKGLAGDAMNVVLAAAGANLAKRLRLLPCALRGGLAVALAGRNASSWLTCRARHRLLVPALALPAGRMPIAFQLGSARSVLGPAFSGSTT